MSSHGIAFSPEVGMELKRREGFRVTIKMMAIAWAITFIHFEV